MIPKKQNSVRVVATQTESKKPFYDLETGKKENLFDFTPKPKFLQDRLRRHFIFRCLITACRNERFESVGSGFVHIVYQIPDLSKSANFGILNDDEIFRLGICPVPTAIENIAICRKLEKLFGDLSVCNCFVKTETGWFLDVLPYLEAQGLILPIKSAKSGLIEALRIYRQPDDERSFLLQLQGGTGLNG